MKKPGSDIEKPEGFAKSGKDGVEKSDIVYLTLTCLEICAVVCPETTSKRWEK